MDIACPSCEAVYEIDAASVTLSGRKVRCAACAMVWRVFPVGYDPITGLMLAETDYKPPPLLTETDPADGLRGEDAAFADPHKSDETDTALAFSEAVPEASVSEALPDPEAGSSGLQSANPRPAKWSRGTPSSGSKKASKGRFLSWQTGAIAAALAVIAIGLQQRERMVKLMPQTAKLYAAIGLPVNLRGIMIKDVASRLLDDNGIAVLVVDGNLVNASASKVDIPRLRFAVLGPDGQEVYAWSAQADRPSLQPGETLNFKRRLAAPPNDGKDVSVRFVTRSDTTSGIK